jgi:hypothetical protein
VAVLPTKHILIFSLKIVDFQRNSKAFSCCSSFKKNGKFIDFESLLATSVEIQSGLLGERL